MYRKAPMDWQKHTDFMLLSLICLHIAFLLSFIVRHGFSNPYARSEYLNIIMVLSLVDILVGVLFHSYKNILKRGFYREFTATFRHVCFVILLGTFYLFIMQDGVKYSRFTVLSLGVFDFIFLLLARCLWKNVLRKRKGEEGIRSLLIIASEGNADEVIKNIVESNYGVYHIAGLVILDHDMQKQSVFGIPVVANAENMLEYICREWVDEVMICLPDRQTYPEKLMNSLIEMGVVVHIWLSETTNLIGQKQMIERIGGYHVLTSSINFATRGQVFVKRMLDIAGGLAGCLITGILFVFLAPMIYYHSPGPIFFSQIRVGKNGKKFKMYKFRSMYMDAEERKKDLMEQNRVKDGMMFKLDFDPRIIGCRKLPDGTIKKGIGNYIRDLSLDEFPQFFNVLKGEMSLVGTRPPTVDEWEKYELHHRARLSMKPGVTGMWQVSGRSNITDFEQVVELDRKYISEWSMGLDLKILFKTVAVVLRKEGSL